MLLDPAVPLVCGERTQYGQQHRPAQPEIDDLVGQLQPVVAGERAPLALRVNRRDERPRGGLKPILRAVVEEAAVYSR